MENKRNFPLGYISQSQQNWWQWALVWNLTKVKENGFEKFGLTWREKTSQKYCL